MNFIELLDQLVNMDDQTTVKKIDLTKKEDCEYLINTINELKENPLFSVLGSLFGLDNDNLDEILEKIESIQKELVKKEKVEEKKPVQKIVIDKSIEEEPKKSVYPC